MSNETERIVQFRSAQKTLFCARFDPIFLLYGVELPTFFWMSKCHSVLGPVKPVFLPHVMVEALVEYEQAT